MNHTPPKVARFLLGFFRARAGFGVPEDVAPDLVDQVQRLIQGNVDGVDWGPLVGAPSGMIIVPAPGIPGGFSHPWLTCQTFALALVPRPRPRLPMPSGT